MTHVDLAVLCAVIKKASRLNVCQQPLHSLVQQAAASLLLRDFRAVVSSAILQLKLRGAVHELIIRLQWQDVLSSTGMM